MTHVHVLLTACADTRHASAASCASACVSSPAPSSMPCSTPPPPPPPAPMLCPPYMSSSVTRGTVKDPHVLLPLNVYTRGASAAFSRGPGSCARDWSLADPTTTQSTVVAARVRAGAAGAAAGLVLLGPGGASPALAGGAAGGAGVEGASGARGGFSGGLGGEGGLGAGVLPADVLPIAAPVGARALQRCVTRCGAHGKRRGEARQGSAWRSLHSKLLWRWARDHRRAAR
jgi:hypothetical protein